MSFPKNYAILFKMCPTGRMNQYLNRVKKEIQAERISDRELLDLLERDPQAGMEAAVGQFTGLLWKIGAKHLQNPEDIKECINDAFLEFYIHRERFDSKKGTLATYLAQIMRNLSVSRYRKNVLWDEQLDTPLEDPASIPESAEARIDLERAMAALKPEDAEIIRMKYYGGMTAREIAASLGLSYDTVKKRHQRSLSKMRMLLLGLLLLGLLAVLAACAYTLLRYFGIIPGYGISGDPKSLVFILEEPAQVENDSGAYPGTYLIHDALLLNDEMYILMDYQPSDPAIMEKMMWDEDGAFDTFSSEVVDTAVTLNGASFGPFYPRFDRETSQEEGGGYYWAIKLKLHTLEPEEIPRWEDGVEAAFTLFDMDFSCRLTRVEAGQVSEYSNQMGSRGGLLAIPQLEEGRLMVGIYPLSTGRETLQTYLLRGRLMEGKKGDITVTAPDGQELMGECDYASSYNNEYFYNWSFGPAQPGDYTLHVPYVYLTAPLEEPVTFRLDLEQGTWDDQKYPVPGGTLSIESCQPLEVQLGEPIPGQGGPFTVKEGCRCWTLRLRYESSEDLVLTGCLLKPAEEMEVQSKVLYDVATGPDGSFIPLNSYGLHCSPVSDGEEDNVVELAISGWDGCYDPSNVMLTVCEPLSMRWEHSFDLPLEVGIE